MAPSSISVSQPLQALYDDYHPEREAEWRRINSLGKVANIVALCADHPHRTIVEIGCGDGTNLERLAELGFGEKLYGLEIASGALEGLKRRGIERLEAAWLFGGYEIPCADRQFDLAVLSHVVEHLEHPRLLLREAARVASYVFVEVPLADMWKLKRDYVPDSVGHINFYSWKTIRHLLQTCDLKVLAQITTNVPRAVIEYTRGRRGTVQHLVREAALRACPPLARRLFTYHGSLLCQSPAPR